MSNRPENLSRLFLGFRVELDQRLFAMKTRIFAVLLAISGLTGCTSYGHLYPVQGPLAAITPPPIYVAKLSLVANLGKPVTVGAHSNDRTGKIHVVLGGEQFDGRWQLIYGQTATASTQDTIALPAAWDTVYGQGFYVAHIVGAPLFVHTTLTGTQGTVLQVAWYEQGSDTEHSGALASKGVAQDSHGNVYKLVL